VGFLQKGAVKFLLWTLGTFAVVVGILRIFFIDPVTVAHNGMAPTLVHGDVVLVWRGADPERADIVVCRHPTEERFVMGRIVALEGEAIDEVRDQIEIQGVILPHDYRGTAEFVDETQDRAFSMRWGIEEIGTNDHYFFEQAGRSVRIRRVSAVHGIHLLGDNRAYHDEDSRDFGDVDPTTCIGQVFARFSPADGVELPDEIPHGWLEPIY
jgi:signal peptidase I